MSFEQPQTPENNFDKEEMKSKISNVMDEHEERLTKAYGEFPEETATFNEKVRDLLDAVLRESGVVDRESFLRALKYRESRGEEAEVVEYIIKNTRE